MHHDQRIWEGHEGRKSCKDTIKADNRQRNAILSQYNSEADLGHLAPGATER